MRASTLRRWAGGLLLAVLACGDAEPPVPKDILGTQQKRYSQHDEELLARDFFQDRRGGFYVDVGAYRATQDSTTAYLELELGWSGIAIDAQAKLADEWQRLRPRARFFSYIVTDSSGGTETLYIAGAISSVKEDHDNEIYAMFDKPARVDPQPRVEVETITLDDLLDREGVTQIDFLSMDIEQGEPAALAGFDIRRFRPQLVCVEAFPAVQDELRDYFAANDYVRIEAYRDLDPNWWFKPRGAPGPD